MQCQIDELIKILNYSIKEFNQNDSLSEIRCQRVTVLRGADVEKLLTSIVAGRPFEKEKFTFGEYDVYFIFYTLSSGSASLTYTLGRIISPAIMGPTVNLLLLDRYELSSMPDSETFIANYPDLAAADKTPFSSKEWQGLYWYEFLFKLGDERTSCICPTKYDAKTPGVVECCTLGANIFDASMKALKYLLDKCERAKAERRKDEQVEQTEKPAETGQNGESKNRKASGQESLNVRVGGAIVKHPTMASPDIAKLVGSTDGSVRTTPAWKNRKALRRNGVVSKGSKDKKTGKVEKYGTEDDNPQVEHYDIYEMIQEYQQGKKKYPTPREIAEKLSTDDDEVSEQRAKELLRETEKRFNIS